MTRGTGVRITVLCEDGAHQSFANALFPRALRRNLKFIRLDSKQGSGKQFVDERFAAEFHSHWAIRRRGERVCLFVISDADERTTRQRIDDLANKAVVKASEIRESNAAFLLIPKWEIETWLLVLRDIGAGVSHSSWLETDKSLKRSAQGIKSKDCVRVFLDLVEERIDRNSIPPANPSLTEGVIEFARFDESFRSHHA